MAIAKKTAQVAQPNHKRIGGSTFIASLTYVWPGGSRAYDLYKEGNTIAARRNKAGDPERVSLDLAPRWKGGTGTPWAFAAQLVQKRRTDVASGFTVTCEARPVWFSR